MNYIKTILVISLILLGGRQAAAVVYQYFDEEGTLIVTNNPHRSGRSSPPSQAVVRSESRGGITYEYYPVSGSTFSEAAASASARGPFDPREGRPYPAQTRWNAGWTYRFDAKYRVEGDRLRASVSIYDIDLTSRITVILPALAEDSSLSGQERAAWDGFVNVLREHEHDHVAIIRDDSFRDEAARKIAGIREVVVDNDPLRDPMELVQAAVESETARVGHEVIRKIKDRNDEYDRVTEHGVRHGRRSDFFGG